MRHKRESAGRRLSTVTVDQIVSSASSLLISVVAAHVLAVSAFGLFSIVFLVYVFTQGVCRALVCEPLLVHPREAGERPGDAIGTGIALGLGMGALLVAIGLGTRAWDGRLAGGLVVLGACLPLLVLQDLGRYLAFATQRPSIALALDVLWDVLLAGAVVALFVLDEKSLPWFIVAWAGSGAASGLLVFGYYRGRPRVSLSWLRETWGFSWRYLLSYAASQGSALGAAVAVGGIAGARALAGVRGALLLTRPFTTFQVASIAAGTAEVSRGATDPTLIRRNVRRTTVFTTGVAAINMLIMVGLPDPAGRAVLSDTWAVTATLVLPAGVQILFGGLISGTRAGLLGTRQIRTTVRIDVAGVIMLLVFCAVGAVLGHAAGAMWGIAAAQAVIALVWWVCYLRYLAHPKPGDAPPVAVAAAEPVLDGPALDQKGN